MTKQGDRTPLLATSAASNSGAGHTDEERQHETPTSRPFKAVTSILTLVFALGLVVFSVLYMERLPDNPERAALKILEKSPIIVCLVRVSLDEVIQTSLVCDPGWAYR